jgi:hypothetical protein
VPLAHLIGEQDRSLREARLSGAELRKEYGELPALRGNIREDFV